MLVKREEKNEFGGWGKCYYTVVIEVSVKDTLYVGDMVLTGAAYEKVKFQIERVWNFMS